MVGCAQTLSRHGSKKGIRHTTHGLTVVGWPKILAQNRCRFFLSGPLFKFAQARDESLNAGAAFVQRRIASRKMTRKQRFEQVIRKWTENKGKQRQVFQSEGGQLETSERSRQLLDLVK